MSSPPNWSPDCGSLTSAVTIDGSRNRSGTTSASAARRATKRLVDQRTPPGVHHVEEVGAQSPAVARPGIGTEVAHRVLEASGPPVVVDTGGLAVEHEVTARQPGDELDHPGSLGAR